MTFARRLFLLISWAALAQRAAAAGGEPEVDPAVRDGWKRAYQAIAESIEMRRGDKILSLHKSPLLFYTNPVRESDQHGTIFLWTDEGHPAVFASVWSVLHPNDKAQRNVTHEWQSLAESSEIQAWRNHGLLWTSGEPGIDWQSLQDAPAPAASRAARLVQMREIARRLSASIQSDEESELRLMPQPLYRYPENVPEASDGALFAFAMSTDPELIILLEAGNGPQPQWKIAFARFGTRPMTVSDGQRTLWSCDVAKPYQRKGKYYLMRRAETIPAHLSTSKQ